MFTCYCVSTFGTEQIQLAHNTQCKYKITTKCKVTQAQLIESALTAADAKHV